MGEKEYIVTLGSRTNNLKSVEKFTVKESDVFVMNGKEFRFGDIAIINIHEEDRGYNVENISKLFPSKNK